LPHGFQSIEQWHRDIHHDHGGAELARQLDRLPSGGRFANHLDVALGFQQ